MIGKLLNNRYIIEEKIALGGMSVVYKAKDKVLNRDVAIKILREEYTSDEDFLKKFKQEPLSVAVLNCPNIVNVYDTGAYENIHFLVMEYIDGMNLKEYLKKKGRLSEKESLYFAIQIATALKHAHENNVIHRDIKPQNIMINSNGVAKLTDFGIAKGASTATINGSKDVVGSVHYLSPEQARGGYVDAKSDIYSLGVVMYEMITGVVPFDGDNYVAIAMQHINGIVLPPSARIEKLKISSGFEKVIMKCLKKHQSYRYQKASDLLDDLKLLDNHGELLHEEDGKNSDNTGPTMIISRSEMDEVQSREEKIRKNAREKFFNESISAENNKTDFLSNTRASKKLDSKNPNEREKFDIANNANGGSNYKKSKNDRVKINNTNNKNNKKKIRKTNDGKESKNLKNKKEGANEFLYKFIGFIVAIVIALVGGYFFISAIFIPDKVEVPYIIGMTEIKAKTALEEKSLLIRVNKQDYSSKVEEGAVISQSVKDGTEVNEKSIIGVTISKGIQKVLVPNLVGKYSVEAETLLNSKGLEIGEKEYDYDESYAKGMIISQNYSSEDEIKVGTAVDIVVSKGKETVYTSVPDLLGLDVDTAKNLLQSKSLYCKVIEAYSDEVLQGRIADQNYLAYANIAEGTYVTVTVSLGVDPNQSDETSDENDGIEDDEISDDLGDETDETDETDEVVKTNQINVPLNSDKEEVVIEVYDITDGSETEVYSDTVSTSDGNAVVEVTGKGTKKYKIIVDGEVVVDADGNEFITIIFD